MCTVITFRFERISFRCFCSSDESSRMCRVDRIERSRSLCSEHLRNKILNFIHGFSCVISIDFNNKQAVLHWCCFLVDSDDSDTNSIFRTNRKRSAPHAERRGATFSILAVHTIVLNQLSEAIGIEISNSRACRNFSGRSSESLISKRNMCKTNWNSAFILVLHD